MNFNEAVTRGWSGTNLYYGKGSYIPPATSEKTFDLKMSGAQTPADGDMYCRSFKLKDKVDPVGEDTKYHIVGIEHTVTPGNEISVYGMMLYMCPKTLSGLTDIAIDQEELLCEDWVDQDPPHPDCRKERMQFAWGIDGNPVWFPHSAGIPMLGDSDFHYAMLEILYGDAVEDDTSGFTVHYTEHLRTHDLGFVRVGIPVDPLRHFIPPELVGVTAGYCSSDSTQRGLHQEVTVFANLLHGHMNAKKMSLRHFRNGKELEPIDVNEHCRFPFNKQMTVVTDKTIKKGDTLATECHYNTVTHAGGPVPHSHDVIFAGDDGASLVEEMCVAYLMVYPVPPLYRCESGPSTIRANEFWESANAAGGPTDEDAEIAKMLMKDEDDPPDLAAVPWTGAGQSMFDDLWGEDKEMMHSMSTRTEEGTVDTTVSTETYKLTDDVQGYTPWKDTCTTDGDGFYEKGTKHVRRYRATFSTENVARRRLMAPGFLDSMTIAQACPYVMEHLMINEDLREVMLNSDVGINCKRVYAGSVVVDYDVGSNSTSPIEDFQRMMDRRIGEEQVVTTNDGEKHRLEMISNKEIGGGSGNGIGIDILGFLGCVSCTAGWRILADILLLLLIVACIACCLFKNWHRRGRYRHPHSYSPRAETVSVDMADIRDYDDHAATIYV